MGARALGQLSISMRFFLSFFLSFDRGLPLECGLIPTYLGTYVPTP